MKVGSSAALRFWSRVGLVVLVNFLLIGIVLIRGEQRVTMPTSVSPNDGATGVSTHPIIRVTYERAIDPVSARTSVRLDPPVSGVIDVNGGVITDTPTRTLLPSTRYSIIIPAGLREASGNVGRQEIRYTFQTRPSRLIVLRREGPLRNAWVVEPISGRTWRVTPGGSDISAVAASPDGDDLAYVVPRGADHWSLEETRIADGVQRTIIPDENGALANIAWSPRGDLVAYESSQVFGTEVSAPKVWLARADGTQTSLLYGRSNETASFPSWSPDGRQLAFYDNRVSAISIFNFTRTLLTIPTDSRAPATWSPDGKAVAYSDRTSDLAARSTLKVARLGGDRLNGQAITDGQSLDLSPAWSPDGTWISFQRLTPTGQNGIWIAHPDGSETHALQQEVGWIYSAPRWAPDGSAVAFSRFRTAPSASQQEPEIWVAPLQGALRRLDATGNVVAWIP